MYQRGENKIKLTKQLTNKLLVCGFIWLLTFVSIASLVQPANAYVPDPFEISTLPATITESGDYYLSQNLTYTDFIDAITIEADNVTINGGGYTLTVDDIGVSGVTVDGYSNIQIYNLNIVGGEDAFQFSNCNNSNVQFSYINDVDDDGFDFIDCYNCSFIYCYVSGCGDNGFQMDGCSDLHIDSCNVTLAEYNGIAIEDCVDFYIQFSNVQNNGNSIEIFESSDASIYDCIIGSSFHQIGFMMMFCERIYVEYCTFTNESVIAAMVQVSNNCEFYGNTFENSGSCALGILGSEIDITNNVFFNNGVDGNNSYGVTCGLAVAFANCTVTDNLFENNTNAIYWFAYTDVEMYDDPSTIVSTTTLSENVFQTNNNTFIFDYEFPTSYNNQSFIFTNNLVNDTAYVNPAGLQMAAENVPINGTVLNFNSTHECGRKVYGVGPFVGGNFWAHPDGTGPSQIGTDADKDGFIDTPLELLANATVGTAYDYHPYSDNFDTNQWVNITLPAEIYSPGHYRIMNSWNGTGVGLAVLANDVVVDGRKCSVQSGLIEGFNPAVLIEGNFL